MKCIIFDCDGVLVDSEIITTKFFIKHLSAIGYQISIEDAIKKFTGISDKEVYEKITQESEIIFTDEQMKYIQTKTHEFLHSDISAIPGINDLLAKLKNENVKICVASSGTFDKIIKSLKITGLMNHFRDENIFSAQNVKKGKPAPDLFLFAAKQMGFKAEDCIVIEDSIAGIEAAIAANMQVIGFLGGSHTHYEWYEKKINNYNIPIAHNTHELSEILYQLNSNLEIN